MKRRHESAYSPHKWMETISYYMCNKKLTGDLRMAVHHWDDVKSEFVVTVDDETVPGGRALVGRGGTLEEALREALKSGGHWGLRDALAYAEEQMRRTTEDIRHVRGFKCGE